MTRLEELELALRALEQDALAALKCVRTSAELKAWRRRYIYGEEEAGDEETQEKGK